MLIRITPPAADPGRVQTLNGRSYAANGAAYLDAPDHDAALLVSAGWGLVGPVGATADRPTKADLTGPQPGTSFIDTTLDAVVVWTGTAWVNPLTGLKE